MKQEINRLIHLTKFQRLILLGCLKRYQDLFDGNLGEWTSPPVNIPLKYKAKIYHARAFPIPVIHIEPLKTYLDILVAIDILTKINRSEWAAPSLIIPKKDSRVIFRSDFRQLNKQIKRKPYSLLHIKDILNKLSNFTYAMTLDLIISSYNILLTGAAKRVFTITTPFGKYEYHILTMGFCIDQYIFQY